MLINESEKKLVQVIFADYPLILSSLGVIYWPAQQLIIVADLHLEKGSYYAKRGNPLPLYDTWDTLKRLEHVIDYFKPKILLSLGDNLHDPNAFLRINNSAQKLLKHISTRLDKWIWLMGNHDKKVILSFATNIYFCTYWKLESITFTHDFLPNTPYQIVGHYHPKLKIKKITGKCFLVNQNKIVMPSFGSYTGGLDIKSDNFEKLMQDEIFNVYLIYKEKIWHIK
ncbi:metallophosphoesterase, DNA ligase-associated [Legionella busanensis]|uniref:Metallophosphoesterase, DNA ligase-associated n=1 Tax=Legionella busanensis TaxID=190655 RepID=A0A378JLH4_9GAMM|nr:ligase-associated DNA damage response endonuclease PdeM [Legionella busanensis]STX52075.1 metallophosphoesterase, DNA ligase-associated [Legionella busanensis]